MTSINFNASATTALRTLQSTNSALETTQNRVSTGLKIGEAKDNAAYWSISTALRSDNKAMSTVKDALGLGAATVDVAYQGLNKAVEVLDEIKSKITAATQDGVDKDAIQAEIDELQKQLKSIATSSVFSSENWLSVDSSVTGYSADRKVVSSFVRDPAGGVTIGTIDVDISSIALFDSSITGEGILNGGKDGNTSLGKIATVVGNAVPVLTAQAASKTLTFGATFVANEALTINVSVNNGQTQAISFNSGAAAINAGENFEAAMLQAFGSTITAVDDGAGEVTVTTASTSAASNIVFGTLTLANGTATTNTAVSAVVTAGRDATYTGAPVTFANFVAGTTTAVNDSFTLDKDDTISFQIALDGKEARTVTIRKSTIDTALGSAAGGKVNDVDGMRLVLTQALSDSKIDGVSVTDTGTAIRLTSLNTTSASKVDIFGQAASKGISVETLSVVGASKTELADYISTINTAIGQVTSAAASLGAIASRIDLQDSFVSNLMDTIDKGISGLIDSDLSEESTRLQALQTKQQLGIQALSIANSSQQNVLRLFQ